MEGDNIHREICIKVPSKVLITGGYLILEEGKKGAVLTTNAQFYSNINYKEKEIVNSNELILNILIQNPQLAEEYKYSILVERVAEEGIQYFKIKELEQFLCGNVFIESCMKVTLIELLSNSYAKLNIFGKEITISGLLKADNAFYDHSEILMANGQLHSYENLYNLPSFSQIPNITKKTGLGSSGCLITSLMTSILISCRIFLMNEENMNLKDSEYFLRNLLTEEDLHRLNLICQLTNSIAQNKVGSGFDITSAIFGNIIFRRMPKRLIESLITQVYQNYICADQIEEINSHFKELFTTFEKLEKLCVIELNSDYLIPQAINLHKELELLMISVGGGSNTRIMAKKVIEWSQQNSAMNQGIFANQLFQDLEKCYTHLHEFLFARETIDLENIKFISDEIQKILFEISEKSEVPILPESQYSILKYLMEYSDVVSCGVPGAGGFDSIFVLCYKHQVDSIRKICEEYTTKSICALPVSYQQESGAKFIK